MQRFDLRRSGAAALVVSIFLAPIGFARADSTGTAADLVPADALYFKTSLRLKEQFDRIASSPAVTKHFVPLVKLLKKKLEKETGDNPQVQHALAFMDSPQAHEALATFCDLIANECFCYVDNDWLKFVDKLAQLGPRIQMTAITAAVTGAGKDNPAK